MPEGNDKEQEIENLFENIMKENFSNLAKGIDFQELQEAQKVPKKLEPRKLWESQRNWTQGETHQDA